MKKLLLIGLFCLIGCTTIQTSTKQAKILEISESSFLVEENANGLIEVHHEEANDYRLGDEVEIQYNSLIKETYPAQIEASQVSLVKAANIYLEIMGIENDELSYTFLNESKQNYAYLYIGAQIDYYDGEEWINCPFLSAGCGVKDPVTTTIIKIPLELYELKGSGKYRLTQTLYNETDEAVLSVFNYFTM